MHAAGGKFWSNSSVLLELFDSLVVVASVVETQSQFKVDNEGERIQFLGPFSLR